jgi:drug/metabolite transporter (DMT)-like permease
MASEPLNLVSPMTAVLAAVVPLAFGVLTGQAPHLVTWFGMGAGLVALVLFTYAPGDAEQQRLRTRVIGLAFLAGVGFGAYFILQARAGSETGLWPLLLSRVVSLGLVVLLVTRRAPARGRSRPSDGRPSWWRWLPVPWTPSETFSSSWPVGTASSRWRA